MDGLLKLRLQLLKGSQKMKGGIGLRRKNSMVTVLNLTIICCVYQEINVLKITHTEERI